MQREAFSGNAWKMRKMQAFRFPWYFAFWLTMIFERARVENRSFLSAWLNEWAK